MPSSHLLRVLDAATSFAVDVGKLIETANPRLIDAAQLRSAANSIGANIAEGFGRGSSPDRVHFFRIARGSTEEAIQHLRLNFRSEKIRSPQFYGLCNKGRVIVKMLDSLIDSELQKTRGAAMTEPR